MMKKAILMMLVVTGAFPYMMHKIDGQPKPGGAKAFLKVSIEVKNLITNTTEKKTLTTEFPKNSPFASVCFKANISSIRTYVVMVDESVMKEGFCLPGEDDEYKSPFSNTYFYVLSVMIALGIALTIGIIFYIWFTYMSTPWVEETPRWRFISTFRNRNNNYLRNGIALQNLADREQDAAE